MQNKIIVGKNFPIILIPLIDSAKKSIKIVVYDWRWYVNDPGNVVQLFNQAIVRAVRRGVKIQAIANNDFIIAVLNENGIIAKKLSVHGLVHAKILIIDDNFVVIGSHNYTHSAFVVNKEISVAFWDIPNIADYNSFFDSLWLL